MRSLSAIARCNGQQETPDCAPWHGVPVPLWTLTAPVRGLLVGSTYAEATVLRALCLEAIDEAQEMTANPAWTDAKQSGIVWLEAGSPQSEGFHTMGYEVGFLHRLAGPRD